MALSSLPWTEQGLRASIRLEGFGLCAETTLEVPLGKVLAILHSTQSLVAAHGGDDQLLEEQGSSSSAANSYSLAFLHELDQMKAAAIAADISSQACQHPLPPPQGRAAKKQGRRGGKSLMTNSNFENRALVPLPPGPMPPTSPPGHPSADAKDEVFRRNSFKRAMAVMADSQRARRAHQEGPGQGDIPGNIMPLAGMSIMRRRLMQHREWAVQVLAELPEICNAIQTNSTGLRQQSSIASDSSDGSDSDSSSGEYSSTSNGVTSEKLEKPPIMWKAYTGEPELGHIHLYELPDHDQLHLQQEEQEQERYQKQE
eukprot:CAMPEP_0115145174 /NCGR_PEP_ID=MMETSP0227-20121206/61965_1 /TAXON_ID=89957 /ORGANISM="Polarella glacialis, Strain CCMP 1383" /LENGTH=313 /DNA_ID=CAMNT_0002554655 /DNA_START=20 /DNA_END=959 /DNA_ORIENTATION=-